MGMKVWEAEFLLLVVALGASALVLGWVTREMKRVEERRLADPD
jgi:hypothetical protein